MDHKERTPWAFEKQKNIPITAVKSKKSAYGADIRALGRDWGG
jgi:hypothetical protein